MKSARRAFTVRMAMSIVVFFVGIALIIVSVVLFAIGHLNSRQAFGVGGSLVGGIASMLAVVYSGPLKDIRQSASDLGTANVAFIGYVHQVLQISHTFSSHYLSDGVTYDKLAQSTALIGNAMQDASSILADVASRRPSAASSAPPRSRPYAGDPTTAHGETAAAAT